MNVLHVYKTSITQSHGGVEVFMDTLCKATAKLGVENIIFSLANNPPDGPTTLNDYTIYHAKNSFEFASTRFSLSAFAEFKRLAKNADIIHYHFPNPFADVLHFACLINKPTLITYHSDIIKQKNLLKFYKPLMKKFLNSADHIVSTSPNYAATSEMLKNYEFKTSVIPIGISKSCYPKLDPVIVAKWRERLPQPFFLFIGAMRYYKGLHIALDAVQGTDFQLALGGIGPIGDELKAKTKKNNMNNVHFLGYVEEEDKVALLHLCSGFVFPSFLRSEAFGISLLEAAAFGKPLISCEISTGTSYVNIDNETGLVIPHSSPQHLKEAMQYLLDHPDKAQQFGRNAQARYKKYFTADKQARAYYKLYQKLLGRPIVVNENIKNDHESERIADLEYQTDVAAKNAAQ